MTTIMSSPHIHSLAHSRPHTPLNLSPAGSPALRATHPNISMPPLKTSHSAPGVSGLGAPLVSISMPPTATSPTSPRSYARQPTQRPYQSPLANRSSPRNAREINGDTLRFAEMVVELVNARQREARKGGLGLEVEHKEDIRDEKDGRKSKSLASSLAGSYEYERAELIVDIPVWSPGCFQDLSTLHALRDTTLSHTHSLLAHLIGQHSIPSSYRLLARSAVTLDRRSQRGWGCIRLAPASGQPTSASGRPELKPKIRRSSVDLSEAELGHTRDDARHRSPLPKALFLTSALTSIRSSPSPGRSTRSISPAVMSGMKTPEMRLEEAIADEDEEALMDLEEVQLKEGYKSGSVSDDDDEDDADTLVAREVQRRKAKEGTAFLMTLFGGPALILV